MSMNVVVTSILKTKLKRNSVLQRSEEWFEARLGFATASRFKDVLAKGKGLTRDAYMMDLIVERLTGQKKELKKTDAINRGIDLESVAKSEYEVYTGSMVIDTGFHKHPTLLCGASPDGLVGDGL